MVGDGPDLPFCNLSLSAIERASARQHQRPVCQNHCDGEKPYARLLPRHLRMRRDEMLKTPSAANTMIKTMRQLFRFAVRYDLHDTNPAAQVEYLTTVSGGHAPLD
jgi:site-specific recombinase XerD